MYDIQKDYAVITRMSSVIGLGKVLVLASTSTEGTWAAAGYRTTPAVLEGMMKRLRSGGGAVPANHQVIIRSQFKSQVPIHTEYATHHVEQAKTGR